MQQGHSGQEAPPGKAVEDEKLPAAVSGLAAVAAHVPPARKATPEADVFSAAAPTESF